ncbi:MAG: hypothetical protein HUU28_01860 [Planctomycetaceae bacterium]|nr:hypothetical protein [Planctomycetaceae bacterium]
MAARTGSRSRWNRFIRLRARTVASSEASTVGSQKSRCPTSSSSFAGSGAPSRPRPRPSVAAPPTATTRKHTSVTGSGVAASARATRSFWDCDFGGRVCLLVGNESDGLSDGARELADETVALPQLGEVSSLNVTVAAGILLYEALRQRRVSHK